VGSKLQDFSPSSISGPSSRTGAGDLAKPVVEVEYELLSNRKKKQRLFGKVSVFFGPCIHSSKEVGIHP